MPKLIKTNYPNLYYRLNSKGLKVYVAIVTKDKKRYKKTLGILKLNQAKKQLNYFRLDIESQLSTFTFADVFKEYIDLSLHIQSKKQIDTNRYNFKNHLRSLHNKQIDHIRYSDCQAVINSVLNKGLKPKTAKNIKALIQVVFNFAIKQNYTDHNPALNVVIPKFDNKQYLKISLDQAKELVKQIYLCENSVVRDICIFGLHGRRLGECLDLQWFQVNLCDRTYSLPYQKNKAKRDMQFSLTDSLYDMFKNRYKIALDLDNHSPDDYVFLNPNTLTRYTDISKTFKKIKIASGINPSDFRFHDFRHLLGTYAINELHIPIEAVSHTLGHTNISTTEMYVTKDKDTARVVGESFLNYLEVKGLIDD